MQWGKYVLMLWVQEIGEIEPHPGARRISWGKDKSWNVKLEWVLICSRRKWRGNLTCLKIQGGMGGAGLIEPVWLGLPSGSWDRKARWVLVGVFIFERTKFYHSAGWWWGKGVIWQLFWWVVLKGKARLSHSYFFSPLYLFLSIFQMPHLYFSPAPYSRAPATSSSGSLFLPILTVASWASCLLGLKPQNPHIVKAGRNTPD